ncbi:hypothetical protein F5883DRAFT_653970 [Diaporthe sp. PMI_573]|nr:hypothetical protein F5883DRAFT_653970 [Diaporthaceae sp. PMI_573]
MPPSRPRSGAAGFNEPASTPEDDSSVEASLLVTRPPSSSPGVTAILQPLGPASPSAYPSALPFNFPITFAATFAAPFTVIFAVIFNCTFTVSFPADSDITNRSSSQSYWPGASGATATLVSSGEIEYSPAINNDSNGGIIASIDDNTDEQHEVTQNNDYSFGVYATSIKSRVTPYV